jgi:ABC-type phosphate transport system permease subunit
MGFRTLHELFLNSTNTEDAKNVTTILTNLSTVTSETNATLNESQFYSYWSLFFFSMTMFFVMIVALLYLNRLKRQRTKNK